MSAVISESKVKSSVVHLLLRGFHIYNHEVSLILAFSSFQIEQLCTRVSAAKYPYLLCPRPWLCIVLAATAGVYNGAC